MSDDDIHSIINDLPTNRASCGHYFHDLNSGGQPRVCTSPPGHAGNCSDNIPTVSSVQQQQDKQKLNTNYDSFMRSILPDFFKEDEKK
jgi:hypothetical protein